MKKLLKCGKLFDAVGETVQENMSVLVDGNTIEKVFPTGQAAPAADVETVDLTDKFVMPGLIDCHVHLYFDGLPYGWGPFIHQYPGDMFVDCMLRAQRDLLAGFTTLRDCGCGRWGNDLALKRAINAGRVAGPRLYTSGAMICTSCFEQIPVDNAVYLVDSPDQARAAARDTLGRGADQVKLIVTVGVMSDGDVLGASVMNYEEIKAACDVARDLGCISSAHAHGAQGVKDAVRAGITSVEHAMLVDEEGIDLMAEKGTWLVPTFTAGYRICENSKDMPPQKAAKAKLAYENHQQHMQRLLNAKVKIAFGCDTGTPFSKHGEQTIEFRLMVESGIPPVLALLSATRNAAQLLRWDRKLGTVESGKLADIAAFDGDPLQDITAMDRCAFVMKDGVVYKGPGAQPLTLG